MVIRNNKQNVTDMEGKKIFKPVSVYPETYSYTEEEANFYNLLTEFIASGRAYASSLPSSNQRAVMLVLISMQKLASSSIAAIRRALGWQVVTIATGRAEPAGCSGTSGYDPSDPRLR